MTAVCQLEESVLSALNKQLPNAYESLLAYLGQSRVVHAAFREAYGTISMTP